MQKNLGLITNWMKRLDWVLTLLAVYVIHYLFVSFFILGNVVDIVRPFPALGAYVYDGWDGALYHHLYNNYDQYYWPPLYPFALRLITFVFRWHDPNAFEKSALLLNLLSHAAIIGGISCYVRRDSRLAGASPWLISFFFFFYPFHNVFFAAYSESSYLALTIVAMLLHQKDRIGSASLVAGATSLVRMMGSFLAFAFVAEQVFYSLRDRKMYWRKLILSTFGLAVVAGWHVILKSLGTDAVASNANWISDLLTNHVPKHSNPKLWVVEYLAASPHVFEVMAFWLSILAAGYCALKKRYLEAFYIAAFNCSLVFYLYRPFAWTRYVSVLFPVQIMAAAWLKNRPRLATALLLASVGSCYFVQRRLLMGQLGEP